MVNISIFWLKIVLYSGECILIKKYFFNLVKNNQKFIRSKKKVAMVGDGANDCSAIKIADAGIL